MIVINEWINKYLAIASYLTAITLHFPFNIFICFETLERPYRFLAYFLLFQLSFEWSFWQSPKISFPRIALKTKLTAKFLTLSLELLSLNIWDKEWWNKILDEYLWLVSSLFHLINKLVESISFELGLWVGLQRWSIINGIDHDILKVWVNCSLMNRHQLLVQYIFSLSENSFTLSSTTLFSFSLASHVFGKANHCCNLSFLLKSYKFLW